MAAGIYLHIPFCKSRCSYCDFATDVYRNADSVERYVRALIREIDLFHFVPPCSTEGGTEQERLIDTIYFGGGTPSLLSAKQVEPILETIGRNLDISGVEEITMEMNPATVTLETLREYHSLGVNRASFGVQTFNDRALRLLARGHDANDARTTFKMLREAGFENVSFDLIAGLPNQTLEDWEKNLDEAVAMQPEHLSLYLLEIHEGTPLAEQVRSGRQPRPDDDTAAAMYEMMLNKLALADYEQYEISNFSQPGFESRHNIKYWTLDPVLGFGVSAHSFDGKQRYANERDTAKYVEMIENGGSAAVMREDIDLASEFAFLRLRMEHGIDLRDFSERFGFDLIDKYRDEITRLVDIGLLQTVNGTMRLTKKGKLFSNEVFSAFV